MAGSGKVYSSYMVYVDESGDHSLELVDTTFPIFVLSFCVFEKGEYTAKVEPAFQKLKFKYFGHDLVIFHERDMRKATGNFAFLQIPAERTAFFADLNQIMVNAPMTLITAVIDKRKLKKAYSSPDNPYHTAVQFCMERLYLFLKGKGESKALTHVVFECRGKKEDAELELVFRRVCASNATGNPLVMEPIFAPKTSNSTGLQFADLFSRPIGRHFIDTTQPNRAYDVIATKFRRNPTNGSEIGWGLKIFP